MAHAAVQGQGKRSRSHSFSNPSKEPHPLRGRPRSQSDVPNPAQTAVRTNAAAPDRISQQATLNFRQRPNDPEYKGNGVFEYNGQKYKVTLYKGDEELKADANTEEWKKIAKKVIESLTIKKILPQVAGETVDVNFSTGIIRKKGSADNDFATMPIPEGEDPIQFSSHFTSFAGENNVRLSQLINNFYKLYHLSFIKKQRKEEIKRTEEIEQERLKNPEHFKSATGASLILKHPQGKHQNDIELKRNGSFLDSDGNQISQDASPQPEHVKASHACCAMAVVAAKKMFEKNLDTNDISSTLDIGAQLYTETVDRLSNVNVPQAERKNYSSCLDMEDILTSQLNGRPREVDGKIIRLQEAANGFEQTVSYHDLNRQLDRISEPDVRTATLNGIFKEKAEILIDAIVPQAVNQKTAGVITFSNEMTSYALAITKNNENGTDLTIELFDSHGTGFSEKTAYYVQFKGENAKENFIKFLQEKLHKNFIYFTGDELTSKRARIQEIEGALNSNITEEAKSEFRTEKESLESAITQARNAQSFNFRAIGIESTPIAQGRVIIPPPLRQQGTGQGGS